MSIPPEMTMVELRDFANENGVYYHHAWNTENKVLIYKDRYHDSLLGHTFVKDYKPIRNFRSMAGESSVAREVLRIVRKRIKDRGWGFALSVVKSEEAEAIRKWLEEEK